MRRAQAIVEYILAFCAVAVITLALARVLHASKRASARNAALMASEYP